MSKTVDERVVSMQFDNKNFESNVQTTMSTLDKLKQKLNLDGAGKSLENLNASARKVDMSGLGRGIETVHAKFSALEVMGVTALANITNSAVNAGKRIVSALTIDPVKTGFQEYELKMDSVRTIMASTGESVETVNKYLNELNRYSDETIYSFADMTQNIGKFTNAGVKLEDAVQAIKGVSNEAAVSGANANEASRAMYNFAQALSAGYVKLIDWKSIENANMATVEFKQQLIDTAVEMGTLTKTSDGLYSTGKHNISATKEFNDSLSDQWMTSEVLITTLGKYADKTTEIGAKATKAATEVTKFTQMWDVLKETAQSGWAQTWELLFGDIEKAKAIFTPLTDFFSGIINSISDMRNKVLESALGKSFTSLKESISGITDPIKKSVDALKDYEDIVKRIIGGEFGNGQERWDKLTKAGYDWAHAQNLVNEKLGDATRHATNYKEAQDKVTESDKKSTETKDELSKADAKRIEELTKLSDAELKNLGYQDDQIKSIRQIQKEADKLGMSVSDFISHIDELDGRWVIIDSFKNIGQSLVTVFKAVGQAWREAFYGNASDEQIIQQKANSLYNLIAAFHKLSENLKVNKETADQIKRTFKGLFAILDIVRMVVGGGLSIAFKVLKEVLGLFNVGILEATANVGDAIVAFRDWIKEHDLISKGIKITAKVIYTLIIKIGELAKKLYELPEVQKVVTKISDAFTNLFDNINSGIDFVISFVDKLKEMDGISLSNIKKALGELLNIPTEDVGKYIAEGLINGIKTFGSIAIDTIVELGKGLLSAIKAVLGIHSPSTEFFEIGVNIILGLINGIISGAQKVISTIRDIGSSSIDALQNSGIDEGLSAIVTGIKNFAKKVVDIIKSIDFGTLFAMAISVGMIVAVKKMADVLEMFAAPLAGLGDMFSGIGKMFVGLGKNFKAAAFEKRTKGIYNIAKAIAVLAASIFLLSSIKPAKMWNAVGAVAALSLVMLVLSVACEKISNASVVIGKDGAKVKSGLNAGLLAIAGSLLILSYVVKVMGTLNPDQTKQGFIGLAGLVIAIGGVFAAYGMLIKGKAAQNMDKAGKMLLKISVALLILVGVAKLIAGMTWEDMDKAAAGITGLVGVIALLMTISMIPGKNISKVGSMLLKISGTMLILVGVAKIIAGMEWADMGKAAIGMLGLISIIGLLVTISTIPGKNMDQVGSMLIKISGAMLILTITAKMLAGMEWGDMGKAAVGLLGLAGIIAILIKITQLAGNDAPKIADTLLAMSVAIGILAGVAIILSFIDLKGLAKGITAVGMLSAMMALMIVATRGANECKGNLIVMTVAIGMMAVAIAALSLIDGSKLAGATAALASVMGIFALMTYVAGQAQGSIGTLIVLTAAIGVIGGMLYLLSTLPVEDTIGTATALSVLMLAVSGSLAIISNFASNIRSALSGVLALTAMALPLYVFIQVLKQMQDVNVATENVLALVILTGALTLFLIPLSMIGAKALLALVGIAALYAMSYPLMAFVDVLKQMQDIQNATENVLALVILTGALTLLLIPLTLMGVYALGALVGIAALYAMSYPLIAFVNVLKQMQDVQNATENVKLLVILAGALTLLLIPLTLIGALALVAIGGVIALTAMAVPLLAFVGILALMQNIQNATENANLLINLMNAISNVLIKVSLVAPLALIGVTAIAGLTGLMVAIGVLATGVGALMQQFPALESFIDTGIPILEKLAYGIGSLVGNLVNGFMTGVAEGLPQIGLILSQFMTNAMPFVNGVKMVDESVLTGVGILAGAVVALTAADMITGITSFMSGGSNFSTLGTELSTFITNAMPFINGIKAVDPTVMEGVKSLAGAILALTATNVLEGLTSWFAGETSLADFGAELAEFGPSMKTYSDAVKGIDNESVATSAEAAKNLAEMAKSLPNEGGLLGKIFGENSMDTFGTQLSSFGSSLKAYSIAVTGIQTEPIYASVEATKALAKMADSIPNLGGVVSWFTGDNSLATFGFQLCMFGRSLKAYSIAVTGIQAEPIYASVSAGKALAGMADSIPKFGGIVSWFTGNNELSTFGTQLCSFGRSLKSYSLSVIGINAEAISQSVIGARRLAALANIVPHSGLFVSDDLANFAKDIKPFGTAIKAYSDSVAGISVGAIANSVSGGRLIVNFINSLSSLNTSGVNSFKTALTSLSTISIKGFIDAFKNASPNLNAVGSGMLDALINGIRSKQPMIVSTATATLMLMVTAIKTKSNMMTLVGVVLMTSLLKGISSQEGKVSSTISKFANTAISSVRDKRKGFVTAGEYIAGGLIVGMNNKSSNVYKAAQSLAQQALKAIEDTHVINSPGKKDIELGEYIGEGTAIGIENKEERVYDAAETVADAAIEALEEGSEEALEAQKESEEESVESTEEYWDRIITITKEGSKENLESELKTAEALQQNREDMLNSEHDYWKKLLEIRKNSDDGESYKKVKLPEFQSDILDKTLESLKNYADEFQSTTDSLMNSSGIFDAVQKKEKVSAETLTKNLQDQVNQMSEFKKTMDSLTSKLEEGNFKDTIAQMGVDSLAELQALNGMSEEELNNYVKLFDDKYALCQQTAATRLSDLRLQTEQELSSLYGGANVDLETFAMTFDGTFASIDQYVKTAITSGSQIAAGYGQGIKTGTKFAKESAQQMIADTETAAKQAAQIQSPSKRFENNVGTYISQGVGKGINNSTSKTSITSAVLDITSLAITEFRNHYEEFFQAGEYCADGFKEGILAKAAEIGRAAASVAKKALSAAKKAVDSHSPSKKFMELGENCDEGFIIGLERYSGLVEKQSAKVARGALGSLSDTISRISDTIDSNMDTNPTIRPVLDLSGVSDGVGAIDGMFNSNPTLGVMSNIRSINSMMNNRQNGGNDDIISAIRDLKNTISNASGDVYNVNGITYDDGSNISSAIKDLVNAAKVERRI